ncbi:MAG: PLDc_N domain-containing protein, partial [Clostridia bacterium]|nr:PLDc_N domain-containing protein [Clostridia bacterium]
MKSKQHRLPVRIIITAIILLLEIYLLFLTVTHFSEQRVWVYSAAEFISILTVFSIINKRGNSSYKIMWIIFILLVPL